MASDLATCHQDSVAGKRILNHAARRRSALDEGSAAVMLEFSQWMQELRLQSACGNFHRIKLPMTKVKEKRSAIRGYLSENTYV